jgi:transposase-like protein
MQCITKWESDYRGWGVVAHTVAVLSLVILTATGIQLEGIGGWVACPPHTVVLEGGGQKGRKQRAVACGSTWRMRYWLRRSWVIPAIRSEALLALVFLSEARGWEWVWVLPWAAWLWKGIGIAWPRLGQQPVYEGVGWMLEKASGVILVGLGLVWATRQLPVVGKWNVSTFAIGSCIQGCASRPDVAVEQDETGMYHVRLRGEFELHVNGEVEFYKRMLVIFLGLLEMPGEVRKSRRTRDGRIPFVRQGQMAAWFEIPHPVISRWYGYWLRQDWQRMLSQRQGEVLTLEVQQQVIESWVKSPWWSAQRMWEHVRAQGSRITLPQVKQIGRESGWNVLRQALSQVYLISGESFRPRDEWLVSQLLAQAQRLVARLEELGGPTVEQRIEVADLEALCEELEIRPAVAQRPLPWVWQIERLLFGHWEWVDDGSVRCIYCGTTDVSRKSRQPRLKKYVDEQGIEQTVEVYRYYCHNPACEHKTFTNLPLNLIPHSRWTLEHHLAALQTYEWSHSVYRCASQLLGVTKMTAYRWVSGFGYQLLPVAALFGVVRSSGVVGIDEKYVLVPKNDKPRAEMKRWMYVYFAVDCYTYDLLHIDLYPYNTKQSAHAFLLALRAKGYHPRVIVTDMRVDYRDVVALAFPNAVHHECIFHALQQVHEHLKEAYGLNYAKTRPDIVALREEINHIFDARTKRTAQRRYEKVLAQQDRLVAETPKADDVFRFLERHWPTLVNAIESHLIPRTNNATEEVIRIFTQHYKTFCGFENIDTAHLYLGVFEKVYRFTPFSEYAQERIRGKCPLELAGYEVQKLPMTQLFRGLALHWPAAAFKELVPYV